MVDDVQVQRAQAFAALHQKGAPLILYNVWDAGSAQAVESAGGKALATGSWSLAAAQGYKDGEAIPLDALFWTIERMTATITLPLSVDFESGYALHDAVLEENITRLIGAGAIGINFEDQVIGGTIRSIDEQASRIKTIRTVADKAGVPLFINARTDLFLRERAQQNHAGLMGETLSRAKAYAQAGANGFFTPGLADLNLIKSLVEECPLPLNIMMMPDVPSIQDLAKQGVSRISYGAAPYFKAMKSVKDAAEHCFL